MFDSFGLSPRRQGLAAVAGAVVGAILAVTVGTRATEATGPAPAAVARATASAAEPTDTPAGTPSPSATAAQIAATAATPVPTRKPAPKTAAPTARGSSSSSSTASRRSYPDLRVDPWTIFKPTDTWVGYGFQNLRVLQVPQDFAVMHQAGVTGVVTYGGLATEMGLAQQYGMKIILGIFNPLDPNEVSNAINLANQPGSPIVAIDVGNEGMYFKRYTANDIAPIMAQVRAATRLPVSTSENDVMTDLSTDPVPPLGDFIFPNVQPIYWHQPSTCDPTSYGREMADASVQQMVHLEKVADGRPVFIHETGIPSQNVSYCSAADGQALQLAYFCALRKLTPDFVHFNMADDPKNTNGGDLNMDSHWGLWDSGDSPKAIVSQLSSC